MNSDDKDHYITLHLTDGRDITVGDDSQVIFDDELELLDRSRIKCFPLPEQPEEIIEDNLSLDTTDDFLSRGRKRKAVPCKGEKFTEEEALNFARHIPLFLANSERILSDSRMFLAPVPVLCGLACTESSDFQDSALGVYIEWWKYTTASFCFKEKMSGAIWYLTGSPMTGSNQCGICDETGQIHYGRSDHFLRALSSFMFIDRRYREAKQRFEAYSLETVIDALESEKTDKSDITADLLNYRIQILTTECADFQYQLDRFEVGHCLLDQKFFFSICDRHRSEILDFLKKYLKNEAEIARLKEEVRQFRIATRAKFRKGEISQKEYQYPLKKRSKECDDTVYEINKKSQKLLDRIRKKYFGAYPNEVSFWKFEDYKKHLDSNAKLKQI